MDLQATLEFAVELHKFYNIDLFQRGFYQIRLHMKPSTKSPLQYEVILPRVIGQDCAYPPLVQDKTGISRTFQILYKNEEVSLQDFFIFKVYMLVDSKKISGSLSNAELQIQVDLLFRTSEDPPSCAETLDVISSQTLKLHLDPSFAIHSYIPLLFDYFHLSSVTMTIHGTLLGLHHATFGVPKPQKSSWIGKLAGNTSPSRQVSPVPSMETVLFGELQPLPLAAKASPDEVAVQASQLGHAYQLYRSMASLLLSRRAALFQKFHEMILISPTTTRFKLEPSEVQSRLEVMCEIIRGLINPDDIVEAVNTSMAQLSGEVCLLWTQFVELFTQNDKISAHLRQDYHQRRIQRFAEGFFTSSHSPMELVSQSHFTPQDYTHVAGVYRSSDYCSLIQSLPIECSELDGQNDEIPIIFEDKYCYDATSPISNGSQPKVIARPPEPAQSIGIQNHLSSAPKAKQSNKKKTKTKKRVKYTPVSSLKHIRPDFIKRGKNTRQQRDISCYKVEESEVNEPRNKRVNSLSEEETKSHGEGLHASSSLPSLPSCVADKICVYPGTVSDQYNSTASSSDCLEGPSDAVVDIQIKGGVRIKVDAETDSTPEEEAGPLCRNGPWPDEGGNTNHVARAGIDGNGIDMEENKCQDSEKQKTETVKDHQSSDFLGTDDISVVLKEEESGNISDLEMIQNGYCSDETTPVMNSLASDLEENLSMENPSVPRLEKEISLNDDTTKEITDSERTESEFSSLPYDVAEGHGSTTPMYQRQDTIPLDDCNNMQTCQEQSNVHLQNKKVGNTKKVPSRTSASRKDAHPKPPSVLTTCTGCFSFMNSSVSPNSSFSVEPCLVRPVLPYESSASTSMSSVQAVGSSKESFEFTEDGFQLHYARERFAKAKQDFRTHLGGCLKLYSDLKCYASPYPYYSIPRAVPEIMEGQDTVDVHLVICVHGLDGNRADLRLLKMYIEMGLPDEKFEFLMSESNQCKKSQNYKGASFAAHLSIDTIKDNTFADFDTMTDRLIQEIIYYVDLLRLHPSKISFIGHSLGNLIIRSALTKPAMDRFIPFLHTFLSLSGPHLGQLYNSSALVNTGLWVIQKWKKSNALLQLSLRDHQDPRQSFIYQLSKHPGLELFKNVLLVGSLQDRYVPVHSARVEMCKTAAKDKSIYGIIYAEMLNNLLEPIITKPDVTLIRYDVHHNLQTSANSLIGRAAHIAFLDSELFLEKFLMVSALKYFR